MKKFKLMLDKKRYDNKPNRASIVNYDIIKNPVEIDIKSLAYAVSNGQSFVASYLEPKGKEIARANAYWNSQEIVALDFDAGMSLEEALELFKHEACFIYTTFSHTDEQNKFRVVFKLNKIITVYQHITNIYDYLLNKYPQADKACRDGVRIFYGGKGLYEINYENELNIDKIIEEDVNMGLRAPVDMYLTTTVLYGGTPKFSKSFSQHRDRIRNLDVEYMRSYLKIDKETKLFYTYDELYNYIKKQDLNAFLGLPYGKFYCIFHKDENASANIITHNELSINLYKCFSSNCRCKNASTIFTCTELLTGLNKVKVKKFLCEVYNIKQAETNWQKEQKEIIEENIKYIQSEEFAIEYPIQHKLIKPYMENLFTFLNLAKEHVAPEHYTEDQALPIFHTSLSKFAEICGFKDKKRIKDRLALFTFLFYIGKLKEEEIPEILLNKTKYYASKNSSEYNKKVFNIRSFFEINAFDAEILNRAEIKAQEFYDNNLTIRAWGYELLYRTFGKEEADRVYPQLARIKVPERSDDHSAIMETVIMKEIQNKGWIAEKEIIKKTELNYGGTMYKERQWKIVIQEVIEKYDLKKSRLNKELKKTLNCENEKGSPSILYKLTN